MGPLFKLRLRRIVSEEFGRRGFSRRQIVMAVDATDDDAIETAMQVANVSVASLPPALREDKPVLGAIGEFFKVIIDWFKSEEGQAFLAALFKILLGLLTGLSTQVMAAVTTWTKSIDDAFSKSDFKPDGMAAVATTAA